MELESSYMLALYTLLDLARRVCTSQRCKLPNCKCPGTAIPGGLLNPYVPQIVLLTMEDSINEFNYQLYMEILEGRNNPNGCPVKATFFISGKGNDFNLTYKLYQKGFYLLVYVVWIKFFFVVGIFAKKHGIV